MIQMGKDEGFHLDAAPATSGATCLSRTALLSHEFGGGFALPYMQSGHWPTFGALKPRPRCSAMRFAQVRKLRQVFTGWRRPCATSLRLGGADPAALPKGPPPARGRLPFSHRCHELPRP